MKALAVNPRTKRERLDHVVHRLVSDGPSRSDQQTLDRLAKHMKDVEDRWSGVPEHPRPETLKESDGRMYPPHVMFERPSGCPQIRRFVQTGHQTLIGKNGSIKILTAATQSLVFEMA